MAFFFHDARSAGTRYSREGKQNPKKEKAKAGRKC